MHKLQLCITVVADNRENRIKSGLQTIFAALIKRAVQLQEFSVRIQLGGQQKRHIQHIGALGKAFADAFFLGKRITHVKLHSVGDFSIKRLLTFIYINRLLF